MLQTPTTAQIAHQYSLRNLQQHNEHSSTLLILPDADPGYASFDSIQQPAEIPVYRKLVTDREDWRASGILHDFNNQLAIILSHCSIALTKLPLESNARTNLDRAIRATKRAADLSSQLQVGFFVQAEEMAPVDLTGVAHEALEAVEPKLLAKATLDAQLQANLPQIHGNASLLYCMIVNLLLNAIEALEAKSGTISVFTNSILIAGTEEGQQGIPDGRYVTVQVSDTGLGMDQSLLDLIFTPFFSTKVVNTGLGLTMALHIVKLHNGIIHVQSTPGHGSMFQILFPV